jgi:predicted nucleic acid-binding protein
MKVVSNSSPLIFLSAIGKLDILKSEFGEIIVPEAVYDEVTSNELKGSNEVKHAEWIKVQAVKKIEALSFMPMLED